VDERTDGEIWYDAQSNGIILVPFNGGPDTNGILTAAIREEDLEEACRRANLDSESWEDIYSLGLGFFVSTSAPGHGPTRKESYLKALEAFEELQPKAQWDMEVQSYNDDN